MGNPAPDQGGKAVGGWCAIGGRPVFKPLQLLSLNSLISKMGAVFPSFRQSLGGCRIYCNAPLTEHRPGLVGPTGGSRLAGLCQLQVHAPVSGSGWLIGALLPWKLEGLLGTNLPVSQKMQISRF